MSSKPTFRKVVQRIAQLGMRLPRTADAWNGGIPDWIYFFGDDTLRKRLQCRRNARQDSTDYTGLPRVLPGIIWAALALSTHQAITQMLALSNGLSRLDSILKRITSRFHA